MLPSCLHGVSMVLPWCSHGASMAIPWDFHGASIVLPYGTSMVCLHGVSMVQSMILSWHDHESPVNSR